MAGKIFINYRRDDAIAAAGRLHDRLATPFGRKNLFMDVDHIPAGVDFVAHLKEQVAACDVFLAIIGPSWISAVDPAGRRRLDLPDDFVAIEIASALARKIRVIPVLIDGAQMPRAEELPDPLKPLARRNAINVRNSQFGRDAEILVEQVREALKATQPAQGRQSRALVGTAIAALAIIGVLIAGWVGMAQLGGPTWPTTLPSGHVNSPTPATSSDADTTRQAEDAERTRLAALKSQEEAKRAQAAAKPPVGTDAAKPKEDSISHHSNPTAYASNDTIRIGILHSLSGTMAISETTLKDVLLMLIDDQNAKGGVLGKKLEAVVLDPASNWPLFAEKARELIARDKVSAVFGCWTSVSRKSVLPVFKELNSILFYPVPYEGEESERNVFYTGATPNQQAIPAVDYLMSQDGGSVKRWVLASTDYVFSRTTNKILEAYLRSTGVAETDIMINYTPFGQSDWQSIVASVKKFGSAGKKTGVISTIYGDANVPFYKELANSGVKATDIPVVALSIGEEELAGIDTRSLVGHLAAANYFQSIKSPENAAFIARWKAFTKNANRVANDPIEAHVIGFKMWVKAVEKAGTTGPDKVIAALPGIEVRNLTGGVAKMLPNHHITKPAYVGEIRADGQFDVVWKSKELIPAAAWSPYVEGSKDLVGDWVDKKCGKFNVRTNRCDG